MMVLTARVTLGLVHIRVGIGAARPAWHGSSQALPGAIPGPTVPRISHFRRHSICITKLPDPGSDPGSDPGRPAQHPTLAAAPPGWLGGGSRSLNHTVIGFHAQSALNYVNDCCSADGYCRIVSGPGLAALVSLAVDGINQVDCLVEQVMARKVPQPFPSSTVHYPPV